MDTRYNKGHGFFAKPVYNLSHRSVPRTLLQRETGHRLKQNSVPKEFQWAAEDKLVLKDHEEMQCQLPGVSTRSTFLMVFSPDGKRVASTHGNHNIYVTDLTTGKNINTLTGHPRTPWCIAFHPSSNQILASGCLGGQVRVWDLHGGSEMWITKSQTVIASIAFHPIERMLVIATYNELYFWDWSQPEPYAKCYTSNEKEKVRYVSFDPLGNKLITGISNAPIVMSQWDRVSAPTGSGGQSGRSYIPGTSGNQPPEQEQRRISVCYRNLVEQYEQLVQRYYDLTRSRATPTMDRGTDPMDVDSTASTPSTPGEETATSSRTRGVAGAFVRYNQRLRLRNTRPLRRPTVGRAVTSRDTDTDQRPPFSYYSRAATSTYPHTTPSANSCATPSRTPTSTAFRSSVSSQVQSNFGDQPLEDEVSVGTSAGTCRSRILTYYNTLGSEASANSTNVSASFVPQATSRGNSQAASREEQPPRASTAVRGTVANPAESSPNLPSRRFFRLYSRFHNNSASPVATSSPNSSPTPQEDERHVLRNPAMSHLMNGVEVEPRNRAHIRTYEVSQSGPVMPSFSSQTNSTDPVSPRSNLSPRSPSYERPRRFFVSHGSAFHPRTPRATQPNTSSAFITPGRDSSFSARFTRTFHRPNVPSVIPGTPSPPSPNAPDVIPATPSPPPPPPPLPTNSARSDTTADLGVRYGIQLLSRHIDNMQRLCRARLEILQLQQIRRMWEDLQQQIRSLHAAVRESTLPLPSETPASTSEALTANEVIDVMGDQDGVPPPIDLGASAASAAVGFDPIGTSSPRARNEARFARYLHFRSHTCMRSSRLERARRHSDTRRSNTAWRHFSGRRPGQESLSYRHRAMARSTTESSTQANDMVELNVRPVCETAVNVSTVVPTASENTVSGGNSPQPGPSSSNGASGRKADDGQTAHGIKRFRAAETETQTPTTSTRDVSFEQVATTSESLRSMIARLEALVRQQRQQRESSPGGRQSSPWSSSTANTSSAEGSSTSRQQAPTQPPPLSAEERLTTALQNEEYESGRLYHRTGEGNNRHEEWEYTRESTRLRARQVLSLMVESLTQFFEENGLSSSTPHAVLDDQIYNLFILLQVALELTDLLLAQLATTRRELEHQWVHRLRSPVALEPTGPTFRQEGPTEGLAARIRRSMAPRTNALDPTSAPRDTSTFMANVRRFMDPDIIPSRSNTVPDTNRLNRLLHRTRYRISRPVYGPQDLVMREDTRDFMLRVQRHHNRYMRAPPPTRPIVPVVRLNDVLVPDTSVLNQPRSGHQSPPNPRGVHASQMWSPNVDGHDPTNGAWRPPRFLHPRYYENPGETTGGGDGFNILRMGPAFATEHVVSDTPMMPNHRIQAWDFSNLYIPDISNVDKNLVAAECKIHNDASVDVSSDGNLLVTLLPSGRLSMTTMLGIYSLKWETLGQCMFTTSFEQNAVSVSLSPVSRHLLVGLASRRVGLIPSDRHTMAQIFRMDSLASGPSPSIKGRLCHLRDIEQGREQPFMSINCIRWAPGPGQGLVYGTNNGQLKVLR